MIVISVKKLFGKINGITIIPFIFVVKDKISKRLLNHEKIHTIQQIEMLIIPFYILYFIFYVVNLFKYRKGTEPHERAKVKRKAYMNIPFEKEAYDNQYDYTYLKNRKLYSWIKYI